MRKEVREHYVQRFGEPEREAEFVPPTGPAIEVLKWSAGQTGEDVAIYSTVGACEALNGSRTKRHEFFIGFAPEVDEVAEALAEVALEGSGRSRIPGSGDTIKLPFPLWPNTEAMAFLFTTGDEIIEPLHISDRTVFFMQLVPLFARELSFKKQFGEDRLWQRFQELHVPYWDPRRKSAI